MKSLRVFWFTNIPLEAVHQQFGNQSRGSGFWMDSLLALLRNTGNVEIAVATSTATYPECRFERDGVTYFNIPANRCSETYGLFPKKERRRQIDHAVRLVNDWSPDVIHVHGTERHFGLIGSDARVNLPTIVSIQGIVRHVHRACLGAMTAEQLLRQLTLHDLLRNAHPLMIRRRYADQIPREQVTLQSADTIVGRTSWDRAFARTVNPDANYLHVDEMIRPQFRNADPWQIEQSDPFSITSTSGAAPLKGLAVLLDAMAILRRWNLPVRLTAAGVPSAPNRSGMVRFLHRRVAELGLQDAVQFVGWQPADRLVAIQRSSRCFVSPSFIENSSNAICEAQLVGVPCVASLVGGTPTIVEDGHSGVHFAAGDATMLASKIERVLSDNAFAVELSKNARRIARERHCPVQILERLLDCYATTVEQHSASGGPVSRQIPEPV